MEKRVTGPVEDVSIGAGVQRVYNVSGDSLNGIPCSIRTRRASTKLPRMTYDESVQEVGNPERQIRPSDQVQSVPAHNISGEC
jgi:hypothetical protein